MNMIINLLEKGILPDKLIRWGIRKSRVQRLKKFKSCDVEELQKLNMDFTSGLRFSPIATHTDDANKQHYEMPFEFFQKILGKRMKYSEGYWSEESNTLDKADEKMLDLYCEMAELKDGMTILELGSGWGSLSLWLAEKYPKSKIITMSNSKVQGDFIRGICTERKIKNLTPKTADVNKFKPKNQFDRILTIGMFEHLKNWDEIFARISQWLKKDGKFFIDIFTHKDFPYHYETEGPANWLGKHFFSGGMMPSDNLILYFQDNITLENHWKCSGIHYKKSADAWLKNLDMYSDELMPLLENVYGKEDAMKWFHRWRMYFIALSEAFGSSNGQEWFSSQYRFRKK